MLNQKQLFQLKSGYLVGQYPDSGLKILSMIKREILRFTESYYGAVLPSLEQYHQLSRQEQIHDDYFYDLTRFFHSYDLPHKLTKSLEDILSFILGPDLDIQCFPHLRISRPGKSQDNLGLHRDTDLGASPYEVSIWTPFVQLCQPGSGMMILPDSNSKHKENWQVIHKKNSHVIKGDKKHATGLLYSYKIPTLDQNEKASLIEPTVNEGQFMIIPQATIHGSNINSTNITRFSMDIRVVNSHVNDDNSTLNNRRISCAMYADKTYYQPFSRSILAKAAENFYK